MQVGNISVNPKYAGMVFQGKEVAFDALRRFCYLDIPGSCPQSVIREPNVVEANRRRFADSVMREINMHVEGVGFFMNDFTVREVQFPPMNHTLVEVRCLGDVSEVNDPNTKFLLVLYNDFLRHDIEIPLAKLLDKKRELLRLEVEAEVPATNNHFEVDIGELLATLSDVEGLNTVDVDGASAVSFFVSQPFRDYGLADGKPFTSWIRLTHVGGDPLQRPGKWEGNGSVVTGPLFEGNWGEQKAGVHTPVVELTVKGDYRMPLIDIVSRRAAISAAYQAANNIASSFSGSNVRSVGLDSTDMLDVASCVDANRLQVLKA